VRVLGGLTSSRVPRLVFELDTPANLLGARHLLAWSASGDGKSGNWVSRDLGSWNRRPVMVISLGRRLATNVQCPSRMLFCLLAVLYALRSALSSLFFLIFLPSWKYYSKFLAYLSCVIVARSPYPYPSPYPHPPPSASRFPFTLFLPLGQIISYYFCHKCKLAMRNLHILH